MAAARYSKAFRSKEEASSSLARVYADVNEQRPAEYWDYDNLQVQVGLVASPKSMPPPCCVTRLGSALR